MSAPIPDPTVQPLLSAEEARAVYGVSRTTFYPMLRRGEVPGSFRCGALWRVRTAELRRDLLGDDEHAAPPAHA
jgi:hypothetical protein